MKRTSDVLIIGAGILGCFAARSLSRYALEINVIEKREDVCCGITKANTGIIYRGYDQHPGSLKAALCKKASDHFPSLCEELDIPYRKTGLLMLSFGPRADRVFQKKMEQGKENNIPDIQILDESQVYQMEPLLCDGIRSALYAENTYTVNPWEMGIAAYENAMSNQVHFYFGQEAMRIARMDTGFLVETKDHTYTASRLICCAGLTADTVWEMLSKPSVKILPLAADYLVFDRSVGDSISHVISVEPEEKGDGITLVPTVDGNILAGPTRRSIKDPAHCTAAASGCCTAAPGSETAADVGGILELQQKCQKLIPSLSPSMIIRSFGAVRPNPYYAEPDGTLSQKSINDFQILEEDGFFALIGIKTPGITCADELGRYLAQRLIGSLEHKPPLNPSFSPSRKGILRLSDLLRDDPGLTANLPQSAPADYFEIICRCEHISKGEVLEAIRRGATTIDGIKRRTGAGMGRCQGGYCMEKILHLLKEQTGKDVYEITKDGPGSEILIKL
ncbi:MAG: NAD(P)/FAD-dependent oxidoreductase [Parasporobacterium sp.]|nr:NAD(P)/FAD-dependent oxidoreductase [Parasporobacterium sp.]